MISEHKFHDDDIEHATPAEFNGEQVLDLIFTETGNGDDPVVGIILNKADAIAIAKHFGILESGQ